MSGRRPPQGYVPPQLPGALGVPGAGARQVGRPSATAAAFALLDYNPSAPMRASALGEAGASARLACSTERGSGDSGAASNRRSAARLARERYEEALAAIAAASTASLGSSCQAGGSGTAASSEPCFFVTTATAAKHAPPTPAAAHTDAHAGATVAVAKPAGDILAMGLYPGDTVLAGYGTIASSFYARVVRVYRSRGVDLVDVEWMRPPKGREGQAKEFLGTSVDHSQHRFGLRVGEDVRRPLPPPCLAACPAITTPAAATPPLDALLPPALPLAGQALSAPAAGADEAAGVARGATQTQTVAAAHPPAVVLPQAGALDDLLNLDEAAV